MKDPFYITTPIYYPNGDPHLGSVYTTVICDVLARHARLEDRPTFFLTGTDEHGLKMSKAAGEAGVEPIVLADKYSDAFKRAWAEMEISNDDFIRTTESRHKDAVTKIVRQMVEQGDIYLGGYEGWYDEGQEQFVTETEAKANEYKSTISGKPLARYSEPSYFFKLTKFVPAIIEHIEKNPGFIVPASRRNEVLSKLKAGVDDLSISRATLKWGIPMPHDPGHVLYVWIDALTNYVTALGYPPKEAEKFDRFWPADVHVIGKDILWFHAVYWPAMLMSLGLELPRTVAAHGWWVSGGRKAGKSTGGLTTLDEIREISATMGLDAFRYYLLRAAPFGSDLEWNPDELTKSYNELAKVLGNCLNRVAKMLSNYRGGVIGEFHETTDPLDASLNELVDSLPGKLAAAYASLDLQQAVLLPIELARACNGYIDATAPFKLAKDPAQAQRLDSVLHLAIRAIHAALVGLLPVMPDKAAEGLSQLGVATMSGGARWQSPQAGHKLGEAKVLFAPLERSGEAPVRN